MLNVSGLHTEYVSDKGAVVKAAQDVSFEVPEGQLFTLLGPSGCGKTTTLRSIAGLEKPTQGTIAVSGTTVYSAAQNVFVPPNKRGFGMVFQSYALYPHMTVAQNMGFGLKMSGAAPEQVAQAVAQAAGLLQIEPLLSRRPRELSGGQRQRVAIGRAIVRNPRIFLFDEPLSNLDAELRVSMRSELRDLHQRLGATMVYVTHDQVEAMTMADRIVVMHDGIVEQIGTPLELFDHPGNLFVAQFIGSPAMNVFKGVVQNGQVSALGASWPMPPTTAPVANGTAVHYGVRPGDLELASSGIAAKVVVVEPTGAETELVLQIGDQQFTLVMHGRTQVQPDETVYLQFDTAKAHIFDGTTEQRL